MVLGQVHDSPVQRLERLFLDVAGCLFPLLELGGEQEFVKLGEFVGLGGSEGAQFTLEHSVCLHEQPVQFYVRGRLHVIEVEFI